MPYVSLGRGVVAALRAHCPPDIPVHRWLGGHGADEFESEKCRAAERAEFAVMTPERFDAMLRARPEIWESLRGVVVDEAHTLGEGARGARVEGLIARLRAHQQAGGRLRLMLLSAALDERQKLESWAGVTRVFASNWTPTARRLAFWRADGQLEWHAELAGGASRALGEIELKWPQPIREGHDGWARVRRLEPLVWANVAQLARQLHEERGGAILCLCSTRRATREVAGALGRLFPETLETGGALARCIESIEARHRTLLPLAHLLRKGVAWHNSSLPPEVRDALENAIADGQIHAVAATSTLAEGVDLPFAQTIVVDWLKWDEGGQQPLSSALFRNIAGRCGRAGAFTEGDTILFDNPLGPAQFTAPRVRREVQRRAFVGAVLSEPRSAFIARAEEVGGTRTALEAALESQLLALWREQPQLDFSEAARAFYASRFESSGVEQGIPQTVGEGASENPRLEEGVSSAPGTSQFTARVARVKARFAVQGLVESDGTLSARGAAIARTDWSPASALRLLGALESLPSQSFEGARGAARLNAYLWRALGALPEAGGEVERLFRARSRGMVRPEHLESVGELWLSGAAPEAIFASLPRARNLPGIGAWLERDEAPAGAEFVVPEWNGDFDRYLDWQRAGLESWTPWAVARGGLVGAAGRPARDANPMEFMGATLGIGRR